MRSARLGIFGSLLFLLSGCTSTEPTGVNQIPVRDNAVRRDPARGPNGYSTPGSRGNKGGASPGLGSGTGSSGASGWINNRKD